MTRLKSLLLASALVPAVTLGQSAIPAFAQNGPIILAQQQPAGTQDDKNKKKPGAPNAPQQQQKPGGPSYQAPARQGGQAGQNQQKPPVTQAPQKPTQPSTYSKPAGNPPPPPTIPPAARQPTMPQAPVTQNPQKPTTPSSTYSKPGTPPPPTIPPAARQPTAPQPPVTQNPQKPTTPSSTYSKPGTPPPSGQPQMPAAQTPPPVNTRPNNQPAQTQPPAGQRPYGQMPPPQQGNNQFPRGPQRFDDLRKERKEVKEGNRTIIHEADRTIIREGGHTIIRHNELDRFRTRDTRVERRGNEDFTFIDRPGGVRIITVTDPEGRLLRRIRREPNGREVILIDNTFRGPRPAGGYFVQLPPPVIRIPRDRYIVEAATATPVLLYETLIAPPVERIERRYTLDEIRYSPEVRDRMPRIDIDSVNFETGSWEVTPDQMQRLAPVAEAMTRAIAQNPGAVFLIEGHTDAVGADVDNLSLSDRRAESVAQVLTEQFNIPPENLTTQGYGEQYLKVPTQGPERQNRRVTVRYISPLLNGPS